MAELKIRFREEVIKKEAKLIRDITSDEVYRIISKWSDADIVRVGLKYLVESGKLLEQIAGHFPRRADKLPKI